MKTQTYILIGFLALSLSIVGTYMFQQGNSSESETTPVSQNDKHDLSESQETSAQKTELEESITVKGNISSLTF